MTFISRFALALAIIQSLLPLHAVALTPEVNVQDSAAQSWSRNLNVSASEQANVISGIADRGLMEIKSVVTLALKKKLVSADFLKNVAAAVPDQGFRSLVRNESSEIINTMTGPFRFLDGENLTCRGSISTYEPIGSFVVKNLESVKFECSDSNGVVSKTFSLTKSNYEISFLGIIGTKRFRTRVYVD